MRRAALFSLCLLSGLILPTPAVAQARSPLQGDERLDRPVTVSWKKATLYDALEELSRATGVKLSPDLAMVDEPIMGSATRIPARALLEQIAELLDLTWSRSEDKAGKARYLLYQSHSARERELAELQKAERAVVEALNRELARYRQTARLPEDQIQQQLERSDRELNDLAAGGLTALGNNPAAVRKFQEAQALRTLASPIGQSMLSLLDGLTPAQWNALRSDRPLVFSSDPQAGELPLPAAVQNRLRTGTPGIPLPKALFRSLGAQVEQGIGQAERMMQARWNQATGFKVTVHLNLNVSAQPLGLLRVNPSPLGGGENLPGGTPCSGCPVSRSPGHPCSSKRPRRTPRSRKRASPRTRCWAGKPASTSPSRRPPRAPWPFWGNNTGLRTYFRRSREPLASG